MKMNALLGGILAGTVLDINNPKELIPTKLFRRLRTSKSLTQHFGHLNLTFNRQLGCPFPFVASGFRAPTVLITGVKHGLFVPKS